MIIKKNEQIIGLLFIIIIVLLVLKYDHVKIVSD